MLMMGSGRVGFSVKRKETSETVARLGKAQGLELWPQHSLVSDLWQVISFLLGTLNLHL